jgi:hypothetical protein
MFSWAGRLLPATLTRAAAIDGARTAVRELPTVLRELPAALRPGPLDHVPAGWERQAFDSSAEGEDALGWLGFEPADDDFGPLLPWPQPERWPSGRRGAAGHLQVA